MITLVLIVLIDFLCKYLSPSVAARYKQKQMNIIFITDIIFYHFQNVRYVLCLVQSLLSITRVTTVSASSGRTGFLDYSS